MLCCYRRRGDSWSKLLLDMYLTMLGMVPYQVGGGGDSMVACSFERLFGAYFGWGRRFYRQTETDRRTASQNYYGG